MLNKLIYSSVILLFTITISAAYAQDVTLTEEEANFLKKLMKKDEFIKELPKAQKQLAALNTILSATTGGPVKLALQWNQVAIQGWRKANSEMVEIGKKSICDEIDFMIASETQNMAFFEELYKARGCNVTSDQ